MAREYEINQLAKEESWRLFRILGELVEGFDKLSGIGPAVTIYGSARIGPQDPLYQMTEEIAYRLGKEGYGKPRIQELEGDTAVTVLQGVMIRWNSIIERLVPQTP